MPTNDPDVAIAFALVLGAGAATALGAAIVFVPTLVKYANRRTLAGALGLSAGVMTYVSFIEIFSKSHISLIKAGYGDDQAYVYATGCFFAGVIFMLGLNYCVTRLLGGHHHHHHHDTEEEGGAAGHRQTAPISNDESAAESGHDHSHHQHQKEHRLRPSTIHSDSNKEACADGSSCQHIYVDEEENVISNMEDDVCRDGCCTNKIMPTSNIENITPCACCSSDPAKDWQRIQTMAAEMDAYEHDAKHQDGLQKQQKLTSEGRGRGGQSVQNSEGDASHQLPQDKQQEPDPTSDHNADHQRLMRMSLNTALAIGLHNFPEGLATFVATLSDPKVGAVLAMAIAIHNIPEGLCVAMPVYYATGNRWEAFGWAVLSGAAEPFAALLGWAVLANSFSDTLYGILFGMVAGMMVIISVRELLPTAHRYDPDDSVVTYSFMAGMAIMALSLVLFKI